MDAYQHHGWRENDTCGTLTAGQNDSNRGDTPLICVPTAYSFDSLASNSMKSSNPRSGCRAVEISKTLDASGPDPSKNQGGLAIVETLPVYCLQGNGIDRADTAGCNGKDWKEDTSYTLNTIDRPAVVYAETYQKATGPLMANSHPGSYTGQDATDLVCGVDCRNATEYPELNGTLQAKANGGFSYNCNQIVRIRHIVRRLTPTECCRLQGFPDWWEDGVEGSDSARYKMWGNGMALPNMLYVMQGIKDTEDKRRGFDVWVRSSRRWG